MKVLKKSNAIFVILFIISMALSGSLICTDTAHAASVTTVAINNSKIEVTLDGNYLDFDVPPTIIGGRTLVPLRVIFESLGAEVNWNSDTKTVTGKKDNINVSLKINSRNAYVNGNMVQIDVPAAIIKGRTLVPARFIAESLGAEVEWKSESKTVVIVSPKVVSIPDPKLEAVIRSVIYKSKGDIYTGDLKRITVLDASGKGISNLECLQYLVNLKELNLNNNKIIDIGVLRNNSNLEELTLSGNIITDISPLKELLKINFLDASLNQITDISPLGKLPNLEYLNLNENQISDITPLKDAISLMGLNLFGNAVIDIGPLKGLKNLKDLYILHFSKKDDLTDELFNQFEAMHQKVKEITAKTVKPEMSDIEKELALHDYIIAHTRYDEENLLKNTLSDESHAPYGVLIKGVAVCDGYARTLQILLNAVGIKSRVVVGDFDSLNGSLANLTGGDSTQIKWKHAWNVVEIDNRFYHVDVTADDPITDDGTNFLSHRYFNISDRQMAIDHKWDRQAYQPCLNDGSTFAAEISEQKDVIISDSGYYYVDDKGLLHGKSLDGGNDVKLCDDNVSDINLWGDWIFYINQSDNMKIYKVKTDGRERTKVSDDKTRSIELYNNYIYYLANYKLNRINIDGTGKAQISSDDIPSWMEISDGFIYYKALNADWKAGLYRMDLNGNGRTIICNDEPVGFTRRSDSGIDIMYGHFEHKVGDYIYFVNESDGKKIYRIKTDGSERLKVGDDSADARFVEITGDYVYYRNINDGNRYYRVKVDGTLRELLG